MQEHIIWHTNTIDKKEREKLNNHRGLMIWFTGLSGSGKSTLANVLDTELYQHNIHSFLLDGDNLRHGLNQNLGFSIEDRKENIRRVAEVGKLFVDAGVVILVAVISPFREDREDARKRFAVGEYIEVYVKCPLEVCEDRDPKGLYKKARNGEIKNFTGISQPYEEPENPEIIIDSGEQSIEDSLKQIKQYLLKRLILVDS